jgi:hypothetical protein
VYEFNVIIPLSAASAFHMETTRLPATLHAQEIVNRSPQDKNVSVYYMPNNQKECLLEVGVKGQTSFTPVIGLIFVGFVQ